MMDATLRKKLRELEIGALRLVSNRFMGEWSSNVRGQGLEFRDLREYVIGDDVRRLDWKATARSGRPQLRRFSEDRQQTIWLALDLSASMEGSKAEMARQMLAVLGWAAVKQADRFGLVGFSDHVEVHCPPARGEAQLWAALEQVLSYQAQSPKTDLGPLWQFFLKQLVHRSTIIIMSDFWGGLDQKMLRALASKHEILALQVLDPRELSFTSGGLVPIYDPETGQKTWADVSSAARARKLAQANEAARQELRIALRKAGVWYTWFSSAEDFLPGLMEFFHRRMEVLGA